MEFRQFSNSGATSPIAGADMALSESHCFNEDCFNEDCFNEDCFNEDCFNEDCFNKDCFNEGFLFRPKSEELLVAIQPLWLNEDNRRGLYRFAVRIALILYRDG